MHRAWIIQCFRAAWGGALPTAHGRADPATEGSQCKQTTALSNVLEDRLQDVEEMRVLYNQSLLLGSRALRLLLTQIRVGTQLIRKPKRDPARVKVPKQ